MRRALLGVLLVGALLATACDRAEAPSPPAAAPDQPVALSVARAYDVVDSLHGIRHLARDASGGVWAVASLTPFVHHFDSSGHLVRSVGAEGHGPGELVYPTAVVLAHGAADGERLQLWDAGRRQVTELAADGRPTGRELPFTLGSHPVLAALERTSYVRGLATRRWRGRWIVESPSRQLSSARAATENVLVVLDSAGVPRDTIADFARLLPTGADTLGDARWVVPVPLWAVCAEERLAVLDPYARRIRWYEQPVRGARAVREDSLPLAPQPLDDDALRAFVANHVIEMEKDGDETIVIPPDVLDRVVNQAVADRASIATPHAPPAVGMLCAPDGRLWLQRFATDDDPRGFGRDWMVLRDGRVVARWRMPARFQPVVVERDRVLGVLRDEMDVERVAEVALPAGRM